MDSRVIAAVARGHGLVTAAGLTAVGIGPRHSARLVRGGDLIAVRRGVYTTGQLWERWDEYRARPLARVRAAELSLVVAHVSSHDSAALLHRLPLLRPQVSQVHISRLDLRGHRTQHGIEHHGARFGASEVVRVDGLEVLDPARTVADIAREHGYRAGLVAGDGALQLGVRRSDLRSAAARMAGWPFSLTVNAVVEDADPGAESPGETLSRELLHECGFEAPIETQFPVETDRGVFWSDLRVGRLLVEFHGRVKSRSVADGGLREGDLEQLMWDERLRERSLGDAGFLPTSLVYADFWSERRDRARERLARCYASAVARFGVELSPRQHEVAMRLRGRRNKAA